MERDVLRCLKRLAGAGWDSVFGKHGFSLRDVRSIDDLLRPLGGIDHRVPGFEDLHPAAFRAIEPGDPAKSLVYHALARPGIHPRPEGAPGDYATLEELDLIENLIYSLARDRLDLDRPWIVAVFAYQYRTGPRTTHRAHADLVFSRAGVARVGNHPEEYDAAARSFAATAPDDGVPVRAARYAAFLAEWRPSEHGLALFSMDDLLEQVEETKHLLHNPPTDHSQVLLQLHCGHKFFHELY